MNNMYGAGPVGMMGPQQLQPMTGQASLPPGVAPNWAAGNTQKLTAAPTPVGMSQPSVNPGGGGQASAPTSGNNSNDWWRGTQFDQNGQFYAPTYSENTAGEANALAQWNNAPVNQYGVKGWGNPNPSGVKQWATSPTDQTFMDAYGSGGRQSVADWGLAIDPNDPNKASRAYEMTQAQRTASGLNNGRVFLNYALDPKTGKWTADPNSMSVGEAAQNVSNRVTAGRAAIIMAAMAAGAGAVGGAFGGAAAGAGAGAADAGGMAGVMGGTAASGAGGAAGASYAAGTAGLGAVGSGAEGAAAYSAAGGGLGAGATTAADMGPYSNWTGANGYTTGSTSNLGSSQTLMQQAQNAYNTYNRVNQGVNVARNVAGGNNRGAGSGLGSMIGGYFGGSLGGMAGGMAGGALGGAIGNSNGGNVQGNIGGSGPGDTVSTGDQNFNWGNLAGGVVGGLTNAITSAGDRNYSQDLRNAWENNQNANAPYIQQLQQSYSDPNSYLKGPEFTAINDLYNNQITRQAAAGGRLGNDTDRQVLLQKFAMQNLGNYRSGLENTINNNQRNNQAYLPNYSAGLAGRAGAQGSVLNGAIQGAGGVGAIGSGIKSVWDQLFGSGGSGTSGGNPAANVGGSGSVDTVGYPSTDTTPTADPGYVDANPSWDTGTDWSTYFSDRRLKTDITAIGKLVNGLTVYSYRYLGSQPIQIGLMADEVKKIHPNAVRRVHGFDMVNYEKAVQ